MNKKAKQQLIRVLITASIPAAGLIFLLAFPSYTQAEKKSPAEIYELHCGNCHGADGQGLRNLYPPLAGSDYLKDHQSEFPCIIRNGLEGEIIVNGRSFNQPMAGMPQLGPGEATTIINYANTSWGNDLRTWKIEEVKRRWEGCVSPVTPIDSVPPASQPEKGQ